MQLVLWDGMSEVRKMNKLEQLINELCPNGVEYRRLENCCEILDNKRKPVTKSAREAGKYPYYGANGIQDYIADYSYKAPEEQAQSANLADCMSLLMRHLDDRERKILIHRFGLEGTRPKTLEVLGKILGFSKERIRQLEDLAINKLRSNDKTHLFHSFLED